MVPQILPASVYPRAELSSFLNFAPLSYSNLDWISNHERLEGQFCYALIDEDQIKALISCEPENRSAAWLRFFLSQSDGKHAVYFHSLLERALADLSAAGIPNLYALSFKNWQEELFANSGFAAFTRIITLTRPAGAELPADLHPGLSIRQITAEDLPGIEAVDHAAFSAPWQLNTATLQAAFRACSYSTAAILDGKMVGYQMSAASFNTYHLARLAVLPQTQQQGVGSSLALDTIREANARGSTEFSVNTQTDNASSLKLYARLGFQQEGRLIPVLVRAVEGG
jgi:ribosomal protein S18 acetylase RimI-like enzyme